MSRTTIEWTDESWNPVRGCSRISEGCRFCYAERQASRFESGPFHGFVKHHRWTGEVALIHEKLNEPLRWRKPRVVFVNSMSDLFHERLPMEDVARIFAVMALAPQHIFQVLTKRPERMLNLLSDDGFYQLVLQAADRDLRPWYPKLGGIGISCPPPRNVWLGVSVEDQETANERVPILLRTPAALRFISYEPALGPVDFAQWLVPNYIAHPQSPRSTETARALAQIARAGGKMLGGAYLDWVIAGGESGPNARPAHPEWFRAARDQCVDAGVPFFFKQWGEYYPIRPAIGAMYVDGSSVPDDHEPWVIERVGKKRAGRLLDGEIWNTMPQEAQL
jgi:protein gp37